MHTRTMWSNLGLLALASAVAGCTFDEGLLIYNLQGTVKLPVAAGTRTFVYTDEAGNTTEETVVDPRLIGPIYLGLYPSVLPANTVASYPHPEIGPQYEDGVQGDTYPYGGTQIGDIRYACYEFLSCKVISGRYATWDELATWFSDVLGTSIVDSSGEPVLDGDLIQQTCFDALEVTADYEIGVVTGDRNDDGKADGQDLDFELSADGQFFEGGFTIWQQEFFWDREEEATEGCTPGKDCTGFSLWGFMDAPDLITNKFTTCDSATGFQDNIYDNNYFGGKVYPDVLNQPALYLSEGDWVAGEAYVWEDAFAEPELVLDFEVTQ